MNPRDRLARQRAEFESSIARMILERPDRNYSEIGKRFGLSVARVSQLAVKYKVQKPRGPRPKARETR